MKDPRIVRVGCFDWRFRNGQLECRVPPHGWIADPMRPEDHAALAELRNHPTEDDEQAA